LSKYVLIDWRNYCREQCMWELDLATQPGPNQQLMGGPFERVQIEEPYFRGKRKRGLARNFQQRNYLRGDRPNARQSYGNIINEPWVFGMVWNRPDGEREIHYFHVQRRDRATLEPIICARCTRYERKPAHPNITSCEHTVQNRTGGQKARLGVPTRGDPADGHLIGNDRERTRRGVGGNRRAYARQ